MRQEAAEEVELLGVVEAEDSVDVDLLEAAEAQEDVAVGDSVVEGEEVDRLDSMVLQCVSFLSGWGLAQWSVEKLHTANVQ